MKNFDLMSFLTFIFLSTCILKSLILSSRQVHELSIIVFSFPFDDDVRVCAYFDSVSSCSSAFSIALNQSTQKEEWISFAIKVTCLMVQGRWVLTCLPLCLSSCRMQELRRELVKGIGCRVIVGDQRPWHEVNNNESALVGIEISADRQVWMIPPETRLKDHE